MKKTMIVQAICGVSAWLSGIVAILSGGSLFIAWLVDKDLPLWTGDVFTVAIVVFIVSIVAIVINLITMIMNN